MAKNDKNGKSESKVVASKGEPSSAPTTLSPFEEMDRMFEEFLGRRWPRSWLRPFHWEHPGLVDSASVARMPRVDIIDDNTEIVVRAELPGVRKEDLEVSMNEDTVTISGRTSHEQKTQSGNYYRSEISRGEFSRTVVLPGAVNTDKAKATLENGVLELHLPKVEKAKRRTISVD